MSGTDIETRDQLPALAMKALNKLCLDSLEIPLDRLHENRAFHETQQTSNWFLVVSDALAELEARTKTPPPDFTQLPSFPDPEVLEELYYQTEDDRRRYRAALEEIVRLVPAHDCKAVDTAMAVLRVGT